MIEGDASGPLTAKLAQALAVLSTSPEHMRPREELAALLWDDTRDPRANLRQLLRRARRDVAPLADALAADGLGIRLDPDRVRIDLVALRRAADDPALPAAEAARALCTGSLLEGTEPTTEAFEDWLRAARDEAARLAEGVAEGVLRRPSEAGTDALVQAALHLSAAGAAAGWRRLAVDAFARTGRPDLARRFGSAEPAPPSSAPATAAAALPARPRPEPAASPPRRLRLAFRAFDAAAESRLAPFLRAFVEDCADHLAGYRSFAVLAPHSTVRPDGAEADVSVTGALRAGPRGPALALRLEAHTGEILWAGRFDVSPELLVDSATRLVRRVAGQLAQAVEARIAEHARVRGLPDAYAAYLSGRDAMRICDLPRLRRARRIFQQAAEADPGMAAAQARLCETLYVEWVMRGGNEQDLLDAARAQAERARRTDPGAAVAHWVSGAVALYRRETDRVLEHFGDAEALSPHSADLLLEYADALSHLERHDDAERRFAQALELNPAAPDRYWWIGAAIAFGRRDFAEAVSRCERITSEEVAVALRAASHAMNGQLGQARRWGRRARMVLPDISADTLVRLTPDPPDGTRMNDYRNGLAMAGIT